MRLWHRERIAPINLMSGDVLQLEYDGPDGRRIVSRTSFNRSFKVNMISIYDIRDIADAFDMKDGFMVVCGEEK